MKLLKGYRAHWVSRNGDVILSKNNKIFKYNSIDQKVNRIIKLHYNNKYLDMINKGLLRRLLRGGIHSIVKIENRLIVFFDSRIFVVNKNEIKSSYDIKTCRRPLNVCLHPINNNVYWGDYVASTNRMPINIYCSKDSGTSWNIVFTFPENSIRHIHNIIYDEIRHIYLILTGDKDNESGIWVTKDFHKIDPLLIGKQKYRATSLIVKNDYYIIPTDTEIERNYIQKFEIKNSSIQQIAEIPSSSIGARTIAGYSFVSTMVEPSIVNNTNIVNLYVSEDDAKWSKIFSAKKDFFSGKYFQYASLQIPEYEYNYAENFFYFNLMNTKKGSSVIIFTEDEIREVLKK